MQQQRRENMDVQAADEKILDILRKDSQKGLILLMEKYTGLVWHVVSFYIENPEDIKECINDTFSKFYFQRKKFDPGRASLPVYLTAIARRLAISRYRKERIRRAEPLKEEFMQEDRRLSGAELRVDMERAMAMLKPNELQIIRMKYYDGMTVREIAESLKIPYETAKKRHQRSILKLGQSLILLIVLLLSFSVCVYGVLRYFDVISSVWSGGTPVGPDELPDDDDGGISGMIMKNDQGRGRPERKVPYDGENDAEETYVEIPDSQPVKASPKELEKDVSQSSGIENYTVSPGYGINTNPKEPVYSLAQKVFYEGEEYTVTLEEAVYINNKVTVTAMICQKNRVPRDNGKIDLMAETGSFELGYGEHTWKNSETITRDLDEFTRLLTICFEDVSFPALEQGLKGLVIRRGERISLTFDMKMVEQEAIGEHPYQIGDRGGVLAVPRMEDGSLIIAIYPLDDEDGHRMLPALIRDPYGSWAGDHVTVVCEDGTVLTGECMSYSPRNARTYYEWNFGEAPPGDHTLNIPVIYQESHLDQEFAIPLDLEEGSWEEGQYPVPGGSVYIEECAPQPETEIEMDAPAGMGRAVDPMCSGKKRWRLKIGYTSEDPVYSVAGFYGAYCYVGMDTGEGEPAGSRSGVSMVLDSIDVKNQVVEYTLETDADSLDLKEACIRFHRGDIIAYRWNQGFRIPFSVS